MEDQYCKSLEVVQQLVKARVDKAAARPDDEDDVFGKMVACEMRKLQTPRTKRAIKKKVMDLLYEALEEEEAATMTMADDQLVQYYVLHPQQLPNEQ